MPRPCSICTHAQRAEIDRSLINRDSPRNTAKRYAVSEDALLRHREHIKQAIADAATTGASAEAEHQVELAKQQAAQEVYEVREALEVVKQLKAINGACLEVLTQAREVGDGGLVLKAADKVLAQLRFQAELLGELDDRPQVNIALVSSPDWLTLRARILHVLEPYPAARLALAEALAPAEMNGHAG